MRVPSQIPPTVFETFPRAIKASTASSGLAPKQIPSQFKSGVASTGYSQSRQLAAMSNQSAQQPLSFSNYKVENTSINTSAGVKLSEAQSVVVGSVLDLFAGRPSLRKLTLWNDEAVFEDPITKAEGRKQYAPQWYGLKAAFSEIQRLNSQVTSGGNPIEMDMKTKYKIKGIGSETTIDSKIKIFTEGEGDSLRITKVEDRWDDSLPDSAFKNAMRNLNSVTVPTMVSVPKSIEEEEGSK